MPKDAITLQLDERTVNGKAVKQLRKDGQVPAVIHDHGRPSVHVQGRGIEVLKVWRQAGKHHPVEIKAGDKSFVALIKEATFDPRKHQLTHVVFNAVDKDQKVDAEIPLRPRYAEDNESSPAERNGLIVLSQLESVQVKAIPTRLPDYFEYDAEKLVEIGDHVTVADLVVPEGVEVQTEPGHTIATVYEPSALAAANDAAGGTGEEGEEPAIEGEEGAEGESAEGQEGQKGEDKPGGKDQKEPKPSSVEAAKEGKQEEKSE
jgi:large subunit ribosomal protein L25